MLPRLPVMLNLAGRRCVVVGGGRVALRRCRSLLECGARITVIAPRIAGELRELGVTLAEREYAAGDLEGAFLVVIATDNPAANAAVAAEAAARGVPTNRTDDAAAGDVTFMAHARIPPNPPRNPPRNPLRNTPGSLAAAPLTLAVDTGGGSASAAAAIRDELAAALDPAWATLLREAGPWRVALKKRGLEPAERAARLRRLTDHAAMRILRACGDAALREHLARVAAGDADA